MITTIACLLLATAAYAENGQYMYPGSSRPMDNNDDIYNRDFPSLVFNFEQLRRDQPPQIETRQEDLGRYMYRPRTTTTPPLPTVPSMVTFPPQIPEVKILPERIPQRPRVIEGSTNKPYIGQTWNQIINKHLPPTIPPPPATPQWMDLSDTLKNRRVHQPHYNPVHPQAPLYHQEALPQTPVDPVPQSAYPQYSGVPNTGYDTTTQVPYTHYMQNVQPEQQMAYSDPRTPSHQPRGHHKFSWDDITPTEVRQPVTPASVPQPARKMPSSIPTLTPWTGDSFGK